MSAIHTSILLDTLRFGRRFTVAFVLGFIFIGLPGYSWAQADLFISPTGGTYRIGEMFSVLVNVNTGGKAVNAASAQINFDNARLEVVSLGYSRSLFSLWTQEPSFSNEAGTVSFSGGLPSPGFTGASGNILRITFKAKASGQAPIVFVSGAVLANDGLGTNVVNNLRGGLFNILPAAAAPPKPTPAEEKKPSPASAPTVEKVEKPVDVPIITDWPKQLEAGGTLTVRGLGLPVARVLITVQKGTEDPVRFETFSGMDGRFNFTYPKAIEAGFYRVWARNIDPAGVPSAASDPVTIEVIAPLFFRIGNVAINYGSIIVTLLAMVIFLIALFGWVWLWVRRWQIAQGVEISEAEKTVHLGFDNLKSAIGQFVGSLLEAKSPKEMRTREELLSKGLVKEIEEIEKRIEKEVEDVQDPKRAKKEKRGDQTR